MRTELYRHFDKNDQLLYVGISISTMTRLAYHHSVSEWSDQVVCIRIERFETRALAAEAERQAIIEEHPIYNVLHGTYRRVNTGGLLTFTDIAQRMRISVPRLAKMRRDGQFLLAPIEGRKPPKWRSADVDAFLAGDR